MKIYLIDLLIKKASEGLMTVLEDAYSYFGMAGERQKGVPLNCTAPCPMKGRAVCIPEPRGIPQPSASFAPFREEEKLLISPKVKLHT